MAAALFSGVPRWLLGRFGAGAVLPPVADFSGTPLSGSIPLSVQFTDLSTNAPTSWLWSAVGQNTSTTYTSTQQNPLLVFSVADVYDVTLTATNAAGSDSDTKTGYITATAPDVGGLVCGDADVTPTILGVAAVTPRILGTASIPEC